MRLPSHLLQASTFRSEPVMAAMAAVAVGMFVGAWVIGPAITHDTAEAPASASAAQERTTFEAMVARPDPPPYRAPTPNFEISAPTNHAAIAKEKALGEAGAPGVEDRSRTPRPTVHRESSRYDRTFDRHRAN